MAKTRYTVEFTVRGNGHFPDDMLRYDDCTFKTAEDREHGQIEFNEPGYFGFRDVRMSMQAVTRQDGPTVERWNSFGWAVLDIERINNQTGKLTT